MPSKLLQFFIFILVTLMIMVSNANRCAVSDLPACELCDCTYGGVVVDCSQKNLSFVPASLSPSVRIVYFQQNKIKCVPVEYFFFTNLISITFDNNVLEDAFLLPPCLRSFSAAFNRIKDCDLFFKHCEMLQEVTLRNNQIVELPNPGLRNCSRMKELQLSHNDIRVIRKNSLQRFPNLNELSLSGNELLSVIEDYAFSKACENLETLNLIQLVSLTELPPNFIMGCKNLQTLKLKLSGLTTIDRKVLAPVEMLYKLSIAWMNFRTINESTFHDLKHVDHLVMYSMALQELPEKLFKYTAVNTFLDLSSNSLTTLPESLFSSKYVKHSLATLVLSGNQLESLPKGLFRPLAKLEQLFLDGNKLTQLPGGMLSGCHVSELYLFGNKISTLSQSLYDTHPDNISLKLMQIQNNPIRNLTKHFLDGFAEHGEIILTCDQLQIPQFKPDMVISCVPSHFVTTLLVTNQGFLKSLVERGFNCTEASVLHAFFCTSCTIGSYGNRILSQCLPCPRGGFYQDEVGQYQFNGSDIGCKLCNPGTFVMNGGGNNSLSCQVCPEGTNKTKHAGYRACFCLENYFRRDRFGKCYFCSQEGLKCSNDYVTIKPGYFWNWSVPHLTLYERYVENLLTFSETYDVSISTFTEIFPKVQECPQKFKCTNKDAIKGDCEKGYRGWMCTKCQEGYFPVIGFCQECPSLWVFIGEIFAFILVVLCFVIYVIHTYRRERQINKRSIVDVALARGKIVIGFYQIMGEFWDSIDTLNWPYVFRQLADWMRIVQFNLAVLVVKPSCYFPQINLSPYEMFVIVVSVPFITVVLTSVIFLIFYIRSWYLKQYYLNSNARNLKMEIRKDRVLTIAMLVLYVTYPSTSNAIFALYPPACDMFYLDETNTTNITLLRSDYSIDCKSDVHRKYVIAAYVASLYVIAFPCCLFGLLKKYSNVNVSAERRERRCHPTWLRFLCESYRNKYWFWETIELTRKVSQTFVIILFGWDSPLSVTTTLTLSVVFLSLHTSYAPMRDKFEHYLQLASLWAIFLNMLVAAVPVPKVVETPYIEVAMTAILILLNLSVLVILIAKPVLLLLNFVKPRKIVRRISLLLQNLKWHLRRSIVTHRLRKTVSFEVEDSAEEEPFLYESNNYQSIQ